MKINLYRRKKCAVANEIVFDQHFKGNKYIGNWYYEEEKTDKELIEELQKAYGLEDSSLYDYVIREKFVPVED